MAVTAISRDQNVNVSIVRWTDDATLATVLGADYVTGQADNIEALNSGTWEWLESDLIAVFASDGHALLEFDGDDFTTFVAFSGGNGEVTLPVTNNYLVVFDGTLGALKQAANGSNAITPGNVVAGTDAVAGYLSSSSGTANGKLRFAATPNSGDFNTIVTNAAMGQTSTISIPDPGASTGKFLISPAALVSGNYLKASGTGGNIIDAGFYLISRISQTFGGGSTGNTFAATGVTASSIVVASIVTSTNAVGIAKVVPGTNTIAVTFTADPGAGTTISYISISAQVN